MQIAKDRFQVSTIDISTWIKLDTSLYKESFLVNILRDAKGNWVRSNRDDTAVLSIPCSQALALNVWNSHQENGRTSCIMTFLQVNQNCRGKKSPDPAFCFFSSPSLQWLRTTVSTIHISVTTTQAHTEAFQGVCALRRSPGLFYQTHALYETYTIGHIE